jgi:hypothetical protein
MTHVDIGLATRVRIPDADEVLQLPDDAYPGIYRDQRHMLPGAQDATTAEDVWRCWEDHLARYQRTVPVRDAREVVPYLNHGRWVADCPECLGGMACWDRNPYACCLGDGCGRVFKVLWQLPQLRSEVMRLVAGRPEGHRNWDAHKGETVEELKIQNVLLQGVPAVERNGLLMAENVSLPDELVSPEEYLDRLRRERKGF